MNIYIEFTEKLKKTAKLIIEKGYINPNQVKDFHEMVVRNSTLSNLHQSISPIDKMKEEELFSSIQLSINDILNHGGTKSDVSDTLCWLAIQMPSMEYYGAYLTNKAYNMYKELDIYSGIIFCGAKLAEYEIHKAKSKKERLYAICLAKENLSLIEKNDGRRDDYCYFLNYCQLFNVLQSQEYQNFIPDFINDCTPSGVEDAQNYYTQLCKMARIMYNKHIGNSDPNHVLWLETYEKYKLIDISYREKMGIEKYRFGLLDIGAFYSVEYSNTANIEYYNKAKQSLTKISNGQYFPDAQAKLNILEELFNKTQESK